MTLCFGFLTIRMDDATVLDFLKYAVRYFISSQQIIQPGTLVRAGVDAELLIHVKPSFDINCDLLPDIAVHLHARVVKQIIALCLTAFLQTTLLLLGLLTFSDNMLLALGIMLAAGEVPRIAQQFGLDSRTVPGFSP